MDERLLSIDIQCGKLLDWLISRRICNRTWHGNVLKVREKIGKAIQNMPENDQIRELLSGGAISYFHCQEIVDILKETEKDTKNLFGRYSSQRMTDWNEILHLYAKDNIYIAEAAQLLSQAVVYDIPGMKKRLAKLIQIQADCDKKEKENERKGQEFRKEYENSCRALDIEGSKSIRKQIVALLDDLPQMYNELSTELQGLEEARTAYKAFAKYNKGFQEVKNKEYLPTLRFLMEKGNVTTYEWVHGEPPLRIEEGALNIEQDEDDETDGGDAGKHGAVELAFDSIQEADVELDAPAEIDWDDLDVGEENIEWNQAEECEAIDGTIIIEESGVEGGVARDSEALSLLDNTRTRNFLLDELHELLAFLEQRQVELQLSDSGGYSAILSMSQPSGQNELTVKKISSIVSKIRAVISKLSTGKIHHLQLIRTSPKYVERLVESIQQKSRFVDRVVKANKDLEEQRSRAIREQAETVRKLEVMATKAKILRKNVEGDISKRYNNRKVNITGVI